MSERTIHVETTLDAPAERVWSAMQHPATFLYVVRGLFGVPALAGRTDPMVEGESGTGWLFLFHCIPLSRHTIELEEIDEATKTIRSHEYGGVLRRWDHTLHVEPLDGARSRYSDTVVIDAGALTPAIARLAVLLYRYRHRRWRKLARKHLAADGRASLTGPGSGARP